MIVLAGGKEGQAEGGFHFYSQVFIEAYYVRGLGWEKRTSRR